MADKSTIPKEFRCASTGKALYLPVITTQGVAYSYVALFEMFMNATQGVPICKATKEPIIFFPAVCLPLHHYLMAEYKQAMRDRKRQDEADMQEKFGLPVPQVSESPDDDSEEGWLEEFECAVSKELAYEPCCLSSGTIVSAFAIPDNGFKKDPDRLVACALHGQKPKMSAALETMIKEKFPREYSQRANDLAKEGVSVTTKNAAGTCNEFPQDQVIFWGLGCDGCGIWPIRGKAFSDEECPDKAGFHLCEPCHLLGFSKRVLTGRVNQYHMPKHKMVEMVPNSFF
jgi:hypothetical protein